ncbi:LacI family DNA-binding transcriptional regulator [Thioclava sp. GXIMD2076]|uniref:LacI family DNA-binding transcriptional regulator n=1 Tax=Thioclava kandeliae TaxID=3070818 RepID=A0ABV1SKN0_9RHOB
MGRPTITDLARAAGVSVATVDRVLNGRSPVREETAKKVHQAAVTIGYHGSNMIRQRILADRPTLRLGVVLQKPRHSFYLEFISAFERQVQAILTRRIQLVFHHPQSTDPAELADILEGLTGRVDAVAATGVDHHRITAAVGVLKAAGIPVFSLLSDFAQGVRESYFGMNNLKIGRQAGWCISKISKRPGKVALFIGSSRYHGHVMRETGFRSYLRDVAPEFEMIDTQINLETRALTHEATLELLDRHPDLCGLYVAGGGMEGAISALRETRGPEEVLLIVNELTPESRLALQDGYAAMVFGTPIEDLVRELLDVIVSTHENGTAAVPGQRFFPPQLWTSEIV